MKHTSTRNCILLACLSGILILAGCGKDKEITEAASLTQATNARVPTFLLTSAPEAAVPVGQARQNVQPGSPVVVTGQVGGTPHPIADGFASFIIADTDVYFCDEMPEEHCPTPWDACCEDPDKLKANRASVVVLDADGMPAAVDLKQVAQLAELQTVTVKGTVAKDATSDNLVIEAEGIYLHP